MKTNVAYSGVTTSIASLFDGIVTPSDSYVLFKSSDYTYICAIGSSDDFTVTGDVITSGTVDLIVYDRKSYTSSGTYNNYYNYFIDSSDNIQVDVSEGIVYTDLLDYCPNLPSYMEGSVNYASSFSSLIIFLSLSICIMFGFIATSLRRRIIG